MFRIVCVPYDVSAGTGRAWPPLYWPTLAVDYFFLNPIHGWRDPANAPRLFTFFLSDVLVSSRDHRARLGIGEAVVAAEGGDSARRRRRGGRGADRSRIESGIPIAIVLTAALAAPRS